jgi:hypothetical protein
MSCPKAAAHVQAGPSPLGNTCHYRQTRSTMSNDLSCKPARKRHSRLHGYLPPEHGAWAMLVVPFVLGTSLATWTWSASLLLLGWLLAYLVSYYASQYLRARRKQRFVAPLRLYSLLLAPVAVALLLLEPRLVAAVVLLAPLSAVTFYYAQAGRPRALASGFASVTQACLMAPLAYAFSGGTDRTVAAALFAVSWLYFAGTLLYVKTVIRKRGDINYLRASVAFHVFGLGVAAWISPWLALPFLLFLARAVLLPHRALRPSQIGAFEVANSAALLATVLLTQ